jgi:hypothetical protein
MKTPGQLLAESLRSKTQLDPQEFQTAMQHQADKFNAEAPPHLRIPGGVVVSVEITESSNRAPGYTINLHAPKDRYDFGASITCHACNLTSYHPEDVKNRYCGNCHKFHDSINSEH